MVTGGHICHWLGQGPQEWWPWWLLCPYGLKSGTCDKKRRARRNASLIDLLASPQVKIPFEIKYSMLLNCYSRREDEATEWPRGGAASDCQFLPSFFSLLSSPPFIHTLLNPEWTWLTLSDVRDFVGDHRHQNVPERKISAAWYLKTSHKSDRIRWENPFFLK